MFPSEERDGVECNLRGSTSSRWWWMRCFWTSRSTGRSAPVCDECWNALTFTLSGLSKICALPQMKLAWLVASGPEGLKQDALGAVGGDCGHVPFAERADTARDGRFPGIAGEMHGELMTRVRANLAELDRQLAGRQLCQRLDVQGGWYAILRVPVTRTDEQLAIELLERAVSGGASRAVFRFSFGRISRSEPDHAGRRYSLKAATSPGVPSLRSDYGFDSGRISTSLIKERGC